MSCFPYLFCLPFVSTQNEVCKRERERTFRLLSLFPPSFCFCHGLRVGLVASDHARQSSNQCDICEVAKVVHVNWSHRHCNWSDKQLSIPLLLQLY